MICYHFGLKIMKEYPNKVELFEGITGFLKGLQGLMQRQGCVMSIVTNDDGREDGEDMG